MMIGTGRQREVAGRPSLIQRPHTECARDTLPSLHWTVDITCIVKLRILFQNSSSIFAFRPCVRVQASHPTFYPLLRPFGDIKKDF